MPNELKYKKFAFEGTEAEAEVKEIVMEEKPIKRRRINVLKQRELKTLYRRAYSELKLLDTVGDKFKDGEIYNCITAGDVDGMSYLKLMVRSQKLKYVLFSTWVMAYDDILQIKEWIEEGTIKKVDAYVGEIFPNSYRHEYEELKKVITPEIGRICVFKNHSKIFAGYGDKFHFGIQTSANINTNPRTENGCIQIGEDIFNFYKDYFDGIVSFKKPSNQIKLSL